MKTIHIRIAAALAVVIVAALLSWCGGYNFDTRNSDVAGTMALILVFTGIAFAAPWDDMLP